MEAWFSGDFTPVEPVQGHSLWRPLFVDDGFLVFCSNACMQKSNAEEKEYYE
jgi:hypothetical protein